MTRPEGAPTTNQHWAAACTSSAELEDDSGVTKHFKRGAGIDFKYAAWQGGGGKRCETRATNNLNEPLEPTPAGDPQFTGAAATKNFSRLGFAVALLKLSTCTCVLDSPAIRATAPLAGPRPRSLCTRASGSVEAAKATAHNWKRGPQETVTTRGCGSPCPYTTSSCEV